MSKTTKLLTVINIGICVEYLISWILNLSSSYHYIIELGINYKLAQQP